MIPWNQHLSSGAVQQKQNEPESAVLNSTNFPTNPSTSSEANFVTVTNPSQPLNPQPSSQFPPVCFPPALFTPNAIQPFQCVPQFLVNPVLIRSMLLERVDIRTPFIMSVERGQSPLTINRTGCVTLGPAQSQGKGKRQILPKVPTTSSSKQSAELNKQGDKNDHDYDLKEGLERLSNLINLRKREGNAEMKPEEILTHTGRHIRQLKAKNVLRRGKIRRLNQKSKRLSDKIVSLRASALLSSPISVCQKVEMKEFLERYIEKKTKEDYSFWIMAKIIQPLLETLMEKLDELPSDKVLSEANAWLKENFHSSTVRVCASSFLTEFEAHSRTLSKPIALQEYVQGEISQQKMKMREESEEESRGFKQNE